ncbi:indolepyruvate oxidoreductase subunit beta [Thermococcus aggregans]|uniref:Indolepyruvate oxidoreductase subunit beta n=1 Tax=Thermococcus aggregans TaxID=110163 RepID=A0A9E7SNR6_THEAG|nr:indolepyruvate oxidoreductase subunit beta [Thermococcus aggregans]USS40077.1 indolepyruvate oxidoreductase subunit beta [Thermococcus aggregans]
MKQNYYILITGVGGQGNILASRVLASAAINEGFSVRVGETYGASQRGGSVVSHVKFGSNVHSPLVPKGYTDVILGFEPLETLRVASEYASPNTEIIVNTRPITSGVPQYPDLNSILDELNKLPSTSYMLNATEEVLNAFGTVRTLNMFMLGVLCGLNILPISQENFEHAIISNVKEKYVNVNIRAFQAGMRKANELKREGE